MSCCSYRVPGLAGATLRIRSRRGMGACAARRSLWPSGASSLLSPDRFGGMTHPQLLGCAMPLQQSSLNTSSCPPQPVSSASSLALLPQETYLKVPAFHRPAGSQVIPQSTGRFSFPPLLSKASALPLTFPLQTRSCVPHRHCRDGGWRHPWPGFLRQTQC